MSDLETAMVVGMGPSLMGKGLGPVIDGHETVVRSVVRAKYADRYCANDYGKKADYILTSRGQLTALWEGVKFDYGKCWLFYPKESADKAAELYIREVEPDPSVPVSPALIAHINRLKSGGVFMDVTPFIQPWLNWYKEHHDTAKTVGWPTKGTAMILVTMRLLRPKRVQLAGFDWLNNLEVADRKQKESLKKTHDIRCERKLLEHVAKRRGIEIAWTL
jgi:hypothetical protein